MAERETHKVEVTCRGCGKDRLVSSSRPRSRAAMERQRPFCGECTRTGIAEKRRIEEALEIAWNLGWRPY